MPSLEDIMRTVKEYILREFLPEENPDDLTESAPLVSGGVLDSIASLKLVGFLEQEYGIEVQSHEVDIDNLDTLALIADLVQSKLAE